MLYAQQLIDLVAHVHRHADRASLVGNRARHCLADPPGGVGAELVPAAVIELLCRPDQTNIAFLDQVLEGHTAAHVLLRHADHQPGVGRDQMLARRPAVFDVVAVVVSIFSFNFLAVPGQRLAGYAALLDPLGEVNFLISGEQRYPADLLEVQADHVIGVDVRQVIIFQCGTRFFLAVFFLFFDLSHQIGVGRLYGGVVIDIRNPRTQQGSEGFFQLINIPLGLREDLQDVINGYIGFLAAQRDQTGDRGEIAIFFVQIVQQILINHIHSPIDLISQKICLHPILESLVLQNLTCPPHRDITPRQQVDFYNQDTLFIFLNQQQISLASSQS